MRWRAPLGVDILHAQQQPAARLARHLVVEMRRIGMAEMQRAVRAGANRNTAGGLSWSAVGMT
jgi:hypothetical protein